MYGFSTASYCSTPSCLLYGPGQGSTCGPLFWLLCYVAIYGALCPSLVRTFLISVCRKNSYKSAATSFVDDSGLGITSDFDREPGDSYNDSRPEEIRSTVENLRRLVQQWERLLYSTGGALNLQKSFGTF
jgi:hypothetical protein